MPAFKRNGHRCLWIEHWRCHWIEVLFQEIDRAAGSRVRDNGSPVSDAFLDRLVELLQRLPPLMGAALVGEACNQPPVFVNPFHNKQGSWPYWDKVRGGRSVTELRNIQEPIPCNQGPLRPPFLLLRGIERAGAHDHFVRTKAVVKLSHKAQRE